MSAPGRVANKAAEEGGLPVAHMVRYEDGREVLFKHCEVAEGIAKSNAGVHIPLYDRASRQDEATSILRDMLAIQTACDLHTDEYAPGSVIEYIKELEAEIASRQVANKAEVEPVAVDRDAVRDAVADAMTGLYHCGRVWSAWGYGTMSESDFSQAAEDEDILDNIADAVLSAIGKVATPPATTGASTVLTDERIEELWSIAAREVVANSKKFYDVFARKIEREVQSACTSSIAAQAGQVAVPEGFVLMPEDAPRALIVAIEREVESQLDASGIARANMCRLDGSEIFDALFDAMLAEAPTSTAVAQQAPDQLEQLIIEKRIAITPENEGGFHAAIYGDDEHPQEVGYGQTPMEAIKAARPAQQAPAQAAPAPVCSVDGAETLPLCVGTCAKSGTCIERAATGRPLIGKLLDQFSELPVLWGLNEPGALVRHGDVFKMLVAAGKSMQASTSGESSQKGGAA